MGVKRRWWMLLAAVGLAVLAVGGVTMLLGIGQADPDAPTSVWLDALVQRQAKLAEVIGELKGGHTLYEKGTPSWDGLQRFLSDMPPENFAPVHEAAKKYPKILFHTTRWQMTWIFVDQDDVVRGFYITSQ